MRKQLTPELHTLLAEYLESFKKLRGYAHNGSIKLIEDYENIKNGTEADTFFSTYGVGNKLVGADHPFERTRAYELLLYILQTYDQKQFFIIHKGTPYYFIAWTMYQTVSFEKALFYMDAGMSEDLRLHGKNDSYSTPSISFFLLDEMPQAAGFLSLHVSLNAVFSSSLRQFASDSGVTIKIGDLKQKFIKPLLYGESKYRSVLTALYGFILEFEENQKQIFLRSSDGGSIEPFINHLFKGARILESLLKIKQRGGSMENVISKLPQLEVTTEYMKGNVSLDSAIQTYEKLKKEGVQFQDYNFTTSYMVRNTTGHSLVWSDNFHNANSYLKLYSALLSSILWGINKLWLSTSE